MELQRNQSNKSTISDEAIIALYWNRDESAIEETDLKYKNYLYSVVYNRQSSVKELVTIFKEDIEFRCIYS